MSAVLRRLVVLLSLAAGTLAPPILAATPAVGADPSIVASVSVVTGNGPPQITEHTIELGKELSLYSGPKFRVTAQPKEMGIARVLIEFKLLPVGPLGEQVLPTGTIEGSFVVGKNNQMVLGPESPSQSDPQIKVSLRRK